MEWDKNNRRSTWIKRLLTLSRHLLMQIHTSQRVHPFINWETKWQASSLWDKLRMSLLILDHIICMITSNKFTQTSIKHTEEETKLFWEGHAQTICSNYARIWWKRKMMKMLGTYFIEMFKVCKWCKQECMQSLTNYYLMINGLNWR